MKLIKPSFEILNPTDWRDWGIKKHIERIGRICYKSEDKITPDSYQSFVNRMINSQHYAMLEHGTVYLEYHVKDPSEVGIDEYHNQQAFLNDLINKYSCNPYSIVKINRYYDTCFITTNYRVLIENGWINDIKLLCKPTSFHEKRITVKFICNRQVSHEFVRHRVFSFAQESTRYCNYTKDKYGNELTFIQPNWTYNKYDKIWDNSEDCRQIEYILSDIENVYFNLIQLGWKPQQAATILPNALKTELVITGFIKDWKHFFDLRALDKTGPAHPQAKELALPLYNEFIKLGYINE